MCVYVCVTSHKSCQKCCRHLTNP